MEKREIKKSDKNNFANNKTPLEKVGDFLREARQSRSLSLEDLASSLRIGREQLIALENGNEDSLPEEVFIRAMVRRIAEKLDIDTSFILGELNQKKQNESKQKSIPKKEKRVKSRNFNPISMVIISGTLGLMTSILFLKYIEKNYNESNNQTKSEIPFLSNKGNNHI